jgi:hypothetical protein
MMTTMRHSAFLALSHVFSLVLQNVTGTLICSLSRERLILRYVTLNEFGSFILRYALRTSSRNGTVLSQQV